MIFAGIGFLGIDSLDIVFLIQEKVMDNIQSAFFRLSLIVLCLYLAACAGQVNMRPAITADSVVAPDAGIVVARVINASGGGLPFNQLTITPDNVNASSEIKPERLLSLKPLMNGNTVFASAIKAGHYSLASLRAFYSNGNGWYSRFASTTPELGTFEVKAGSVTDLGTLIYYPKPQDDKYIDLVLRAPETEPGDVLAKYFPFYNTLYNSQETIGWLPDDSQDERETRFISVLQNPITYTDHIKGPDGSLYFLGKLGVIVKRDASGIWSLDAVDTLLDLTTLAVNHRGDLVVGGAEGRLFVKPVDQPWQDHSLGHSFHIEHLQFPDDETIELLASKGAALFVYRTVDFKQGIQWSELNSYSRHQGWESTEIAPKEDANSQKKLRIENIYSVTLSNVESRKLITVRTQRVSSDPVFGRVNKQVFEYDPASWSITQPADDIDISAVIDAGAAKLGVKMPGFWSWDGKPDYFLYKENSGWEELNTHIYSCRNGEQPSAVNTCGDADPPLKAKRKTFTLRSVPWFVSQDEGLAIVTFTSVNLWSGKRDYDVKLLTTTDGGKSWTITDNEPPQKYCSSVIAELEDVLLISCSGATGDFYESHDRGETWQHVRQQENF